MMEMGVEYKYKNMIINYLLPEIRAHIFFK